jgi:gliding motility-associated lipoprotein GldD
LKTSLLALFFVLFAMQACRTRRADEAPIFSPKPKGYNRIDLPSHSYKTIEAGHPYSFEIAKEAIVRPDTLARAEPHWIYVEYPQLGAQVQFTYKPVLGSKTKLQQYIADARKLTAKHQIKAYAIKEREYTASTGQKAQFFELEGEVPSQMQFFTTDSTQHFLRAALYFKTATANDSLAPIIEHIKIDMLHMVNTLKWQ